MRKRYALVLLVVLSLGVAALFVTQYVNNGSVAPLIADNVACSYDYLSDELNGDIDESNAVVCMRYQFLDRFAILEAYWQSREEQQHRGHHDYEPWVSPVSEIEEYELSKQRKLLSALHALTNIYNNPNLGMCPELWIEPCLSAGRLGCVDEFNKRRTYFSIPANFSYLTVGARFFDGSEYFFYIGVGHEPTQRCIDFILDFTGISPEMAYIVKDV